MNVTLLRHTEHPEEIVWQAARTCYSAEPPTQLKATSRDKKAALIRKVMKSGHLSVLSHVSFCFSIEGVSRALSHQLVRNKGFFSQQSQRYVKSAPLNLVCPPSIQGNPDAAYTFEAVMNVIEDAYHGLLNLGIPAEDARYVLPNAATTNLVVTMNARELLHFFELRCCARAQWEIRDMAERMRAICLTVAPVLFEDAGAPCYSGECREANPCGKEDL